MYRFIILWVIKLQVCNEMMIELYRRGETIP